MINVSIFLYADDSILLIVMNADGVNRQTFPIRFLWSVRCHLASYPGLPQISALYTVLRDIVFQRKPPYLTDIFCPK